MANKRILDVVDSPADLKLLTDDELSILAREIREQIITTTSKTGGHVASSLGAVEIILAVHSLLNCPEDKFIFDVGHQSYAHKLVTGRRVPWHFRFPEAFRERIRRARFWPRVRLAFGCRRAR